MSAHLGPSDPQTGRIRYSRADLLGLRTANALLPRKTRRTLWFFKLLLRPTPSSASAFSRPTPSSSTREPQINEQPSLIPVRITNRIDHPIGYNIRNNVSSNLVKIRFDPKPRKPKSSFSSPSVLYFNARSLKNKIDELSSRCRLQNPDIIAITETWLDPLVPDSFVCISGYNLARCDRNANGGGVALYIKSSIAFDLVPLSLPSHLKTNILACNLISLSVFFFCVYHPYWGSSKEHQVVLDVLQDVFDSPLCASFPRHQIILCGDVNGLFPPLPPFSHATTSLSLSSLRLVVTIF